MIGFLIVMPYDKQWGVFAGISDYSSCFMEKSWTNGWYVSGQ